MIAVNLGAPVYRQCGTILLTRLDFHTAQCFRQDGGRFSARPGYIQNQFRGCELFIDPYYVGKRLSILGIQELLKMFDAPSPWRRCWR